MRGFEQLELLRKPLERPVLNNGRYLLCMGKRTFKIFESDFTDTKFMKKIQRDLGVKLFHECEQVFSDYLNHCVDENQSNGFFVFGKIVRDEKLGIGKRISNVWSQMEGIYGKGKINDDHIRRVLGTICMLQVIRDDRQWACKQDIDKKEKLMDGEIPDATEYWILT